MSLSTSSSPTDLLAFSLTKECNCEIMDLLVGSRWFIPNDGATLIPSALIYVFS